MEELFTILLAELKKEPKEKVYLIPYAGLISSIEEQYRMKVVLSELAKDNQVLIFTNSLILLDDIVINVDRGENDKETYIAVVSKANTVLAENMIRILNNNI